jgi:Do/DeqQ family serine protease
MKENKKNLMYLGVGSLLTLAILVIVGSRQSAVDPDRSIQSDQSEVFQQTAYSTPVPQNAPNFIDAADESIHAVVHIKTEYERKPSMYDYFYDFHDFFERRGRQGSRAVVATGSGVIISDDGYIVTNNHVVEGADNISVTLNDKRTYEAKIVGTDPSTDLALIKVEANDLPYLVYGDSDKVKVGEWVLAVGNPFNLTSTVTAGIVSAKARNINILGPAAGSSAIESFIQTDAAVNKGNSGGALVNTNGELIGINAAIASGTGYYAGYSFAIPVNIVRKVVDDLLQYGRVQRAYIGVRITEVNSQLAEEQGLDKIEGVYIADVTQNGSAEAAGIEAGDIILSVEGQDVNTVSELLGKVGQYRPGDVVDVTVKRDGDIRNYSLTLTDKYGKEVITKEAPSEVVSLFGAEFGTPDSETMNKLGIDYGVQITNLERGSRLAKSGMEEGFIITRIDKTQVNSPSDVREILEGKRGGVLIEGIYPSGTVAYYGFGL